MIMHMIKPFMMPDNYDSGSWGEGIDDDAIKRPCKSSLRNQTDSPPSGHSQLRGSRKDMAAENPDAGE
jgi:hypothetical protein